MVFLGKSSKNTFHSSAFNGQTEHLKDFFFFSLDNSSLLRQHYNRITSVICYRRVISLGIRYPPIPGPRFLPPKLSPKAKAIEVFKYSVVCNINEYGTIITP